MELREAVYYICRIKGFSLVGRLAYLCFYRLLSFLFWLTPEIRSLYVAGSIASGDFVPGLSDIDFIVVVKGMTAEEEYRFLKELEKKIRYLMPPFGKEKIGSHIFIYSCEEWAIFGDLALGKEFGSPRTVFEKGNVTLKERYSCFTKGLHHLYKGQWRLEVVQQYLFLPKKSRFSLGFLERVIDKCVLSVTSGFYEITREPQSASFHRGIRDQINDLAGQVHRSKKDSFEDAFLKLNHLFHLVVENACRPYPKTKSVSNEASEIRTSACIEKQKLQTRDLVEEAQGVLRGMAETHSILVSRAGENDYFLFDPQNYGITDSLIKHYKTKNRRTLKIFSKAWFEKLHLNFPVPPMCFFDLRDGTQEILRGYFDSVRLMIEVYSILPKVRSPKNFTDPDRFRLIQNQMLQQIEILKSQIGAKESDKEFSDDLSPKFENNSDADKEYERFQVLKAMSLVLKKYWDYFLVCLDPSDPLLKRQ